MDAERREFEKAIPCFHCSRSLQRLKKSPQVYARRGAPYVGYVLTDAQGIERVLHRGCLADFASGEPWEFEDEITEGDLAYLRGCEGDL